MSVLMNELDLLRDRGSLYRLLEHYAGLGQADPEAWHARATEWDGADAEELVRLHGLLIAFNWAEINAGQTAAGRSGRIACCYRATPGGKRALRRLDNEDPEAEAEAA
jgi:hypothetical protein